jgi:large subunit ribosomal protein L3
MKGIIGKKVGMTQIFDENGTVTPVTVIQAGPCYVTQVRNADRDGYTAVQLGFEETKPKRLTRGQLGHLQRNNLPALRYLREFRVKNGDSQALEEGQKITVSTAFEVGDHVDVVGTSKGRGYAGTIKRHGFHRGPKTHGQSDRMRSPGSIGATSTPGRVLKGMRMAGRMGNQRVTAQNLEVMVVDEERNLLAVKGSVPGAKGGLVVIKPTIKGKSRH